jgi:hypothetical protein
MIKVRFNERGSDRENEINFREIACQFFKVSSTATTTTTKRDWTIDLRLCEDLTPTTDAIIRRVISMMIVTIDIMREVIG